MPSEVILPDMGLIQPPINGDVNTWGGILNSNTAKIDSHNHAFGQGDRVPTAGIVIDEDLTFAGSFAPINVHRIQFSEIAAITDGAENESIFVNAADSELYWRTALGNNVKLTAGNSLNVSAFVGGIVGDYVAVGAAEAFVDSDKAYTFKDGAGHRARVDAGSVKLLAFGTNNTIGVTLAARSDIALSYTATWPNALPGSTSIVQIDNTGQMSYSNTIANAITLSGGIANNVTLSSGATVSVNQNITVSGTGDIKHGTRTLIVPVTTPQAPGLATVQLTLTSSNLGASIGLPLVVGDRISAIRAVVTDNATGPTKLVVRLSTSVAGSALSTVATGAQSAGNGTLQTISVTGLTTDVIVGSVFYAVVVATAGSASCTLNTIEVDYSRP